MIARALRLSRRCSEPLCLLSIVLSAVACSSGTGSDPNVSGANGGMIGAGGSNGPAGSGNVNGGSATVSAGSANASAGTAAASAGSGTGSAGSNSAGMNASGGSDAGAAGLVAAGGKPAGGAGNAGSAGLSHAGSPGVAGAGSGAGAPGAGGAPNTGGPGYPFVFSVFNDAAPASTLQIYTSNDALNFTLLLDTAFGGPTGNLRDPSIMKHTDGKFYVAHTTPPAGTGCCGPESSFSIASSADLKKWTTIATVPSGVAGVKNVWAPEWYKDSDGSIHILANIDGKTYRYEPTDATLTKWGAGTWIGIGPGYIDTFIVKLDTTYHAFTKKEATLFIEHATATSIDGPWTFIGTGNWANWGTHREAPALILLDNGTWRFYCDGGSAGHEMYSDSSDVFKTWTAIKTLPAVGNNISHGTVIRGQ
jgi:hypothetical protein